MVMSCEQVWREMSDYLEGDMDVQKRAALEEHVRGCKKCAAVVEGTKNVVRLYGDERMLEVPLGFSHRLHRKLEDNMPRRRGTAWGWMTALAFAGLVLVALQVGHSRFSVKQRSQLAQPGSHIPAEMAVVVSAEGKVFHVAGCRFIHDKEHVRTLLAAEAIREGYVPCVRCLRKYLTAIEIESLSQTQVVEEDREGGSTE